jgi:hypothetical protein
MTEARVERDFLGACPSPATRSTDPPSQFTALIGALGQLKEAGTRRAQRGPARQVELRSVKDRWRRD